MPDGYDVFLSHNSRDKPVVEELCTLLERQGLRVWLDKKELRPGFPWQEGLEEGIQASRAGAVFVGVEGLSSWQEPEMRAFIARSRRERIPVIPVLLPGCPESPQLTVFLEAFTWVDLRKELTEDGFSQLVWGIAGRKPEGNGALVASATPRFTASMVLAAAGTRVLLVARDLEDHPLAGFRFSYGGVVSRATNQAGATSLNLPPGQGPGQQIKILLVHRSQKTEDWFLVNPQVNIPAGSASAELVLMRRRDFRQIAAEARDAPSARTPRSDEQPTAEDPKRALVAAAARHGLTVEQLESAIRSFAETQDPKDRGIAAYLEGQYPQAEELLNGAVEKKESDFVETLRYLGATQYQQAKYRAAAESFRKALALRSEDPTLLSWLGMALHALAAWTEAEPLMRRALDIDEKSYGKEHPEVATDLNNLAALLKATNRLAEAEPLMRRALDIDEKSYGKEHPNVARDLNNLAVLFQATNRLAEAEPLMRRALDIVEKSYGKEHPNVAIRLNNLALLLYATNRLAEAEPLMRRALAILLDFSRRTGYEHPNQETVSANYRGLLRAMGKSPAEIEETIKALN